MIGRPTWNSLLLGLCVSTCVGLSVGFQPSMLRADDAADATKAANVRKVTWAHIELKGACPEAVEAPGVFGELEETLPVLLRRIDKAGNDLSLEGVFLHIKSPQIGWGKLHELREAIARARGKGKQFFAWLESAETTDYLLATACDKVYMPAVGMVLIPGPRAEISFYKDLFDKLSIQAEMLRVGEYKSAAEPYTRSEMSPAFKEEMDALLDDNYQRTLKMVSEARGLSLDAVKQVIDTALLTGNAAKDAGLIDGCIYEGDLNALAKGDRADVEIEVTKNYGRPKLDTDFSGLNGFVKMMNLLAGTDSQPRKTSTPKIAVIYATGMIMAGSSTSDLLGTSVMGSSTIVKAIREARDDATVKAVVLRVDSPGGSALASDLIWHELETVEKPVIASMGDVAASGGYYISMGADRIFAEPGTITGSIGVVGGKFALEKFFEQFGVKTNVLQRGKNGGILSITTPLNDTERATFQKLLDETYQQFTQKAATGRKMEYDKLEKLARGRVYSGTQALEIGLVDQIGTLEDAVAHARQLAGLGEKDKVERLRLPKAVSPLEQLFGPISDDVQSRADAGTRDAIRHLLRDAIPAEAQTALEGLSLSTILSREPVLTVLPYRLRIR